MAHVQGAPGSWSCQSSRCSTAKPSLSNTRPKEDVSHLCTKNRSQCDYVRSEVIYALFSPHNFSQNTSTSSNSASRQERITRDVGFPGWAKCHPEQQRKAYTSGDKRPSSAMHALPRQTSSVSHTLRSSLLLGLFSSSRRQKSHEALLFNRAGGRKEGDEGEGIFPWDSPEPRFQLNKLCSSTSRS